MVANQQQPAEAVSLYYQRVDAGDVPGILQLFAENALYRRAGYEPIVGHYALRDFYLNQRVIRSGQHRVTKLVCDGADVAAALLSPREAPPGGRPGLGPHQARP